MEFEVEHLCKKIRKVNNQQLKDYTKLLRKFLLHEGIEQHLVDKALKSAIQAFQKSPPFEDLCLKAMCSAQDKTCLKGKRGIDAIGRILVQFCFFKVPKTKMVWPQSSLKDKEARKKYVPGIIPRPLMSYFLVSVRGSIPELNNFEASSVLFGEENQAHEERKRLVNALVKEFDSSDPLQTKNKWETIYSDQRFQDIARDLIGDIRRKIEEFGLERYLRILENLRQRDPDKNNQYSMRRPFNLEDIKQLEEALWAAEEALAKPLK